jgi:pimeloyl-ACP methyl ester carboxylesterase
MGNLPEKSSAPLDLRVLGEESVGGITRRKITFVSEGFAGEPDRVSAYLLLPDGSRRTGKKTAAVLCLHQTTRIGKGEPAGVGGKPDLHYALELAQRGYVTLAPDYPNFGGYEFDPYARGYVSATMKGIVNHRRAIDLLQSLPEVDPDRVGVIGHSLGGHNALFLAAFDDRVKVIITSCGFTSFAKYMKGDLTGWSHKGYMPRIADQYAKDPKQMPFDFSDILVSLAPRAVFINAPLRDDNFEVSGVRDCVEAALPVYDKVFHAKKKLKVLYPNSAHEFPAAVRRAAYGFLDRSLK